MTDIQRRAAFVRDGIWQWAVPFGAIVLALLCSAALLAAADVDPLVGLQELTLGPYTSWQGIGDVISNATPLIFTGLAVTLCFRAGIFSLGAEGQLYVGALTGAATVLLLDDFPGWVLIVLGLTMGALGGAAWAVLPAVGRAFKGTDEIMSTLLLNFIAIYLVTYMVAPGLGPLNGEGVSFAGSDYISPQAQIPSFIPGAETNTVFILGLVLALAMALTLGRTSFGFQVRVRGFNPHAADYAGHSESKVVLSTMVLSGAIAGLAGISTILTTTFLLGADLSPAPGWGYMGIAVALLAGLRPLAVIPSALLFGTLTAGGQHLTIATSAPSSISSVTQALVIGLLLCGTGLQSRWSRKRAITLTTKLSRDAIAGPDGQSSAVTAQEEGL